MHLLRRDSESVRKGGLLPKSPRLRAIETTSVDRMICENQHDIFHLDLHHDFTTLTDLVTAEFH
jgi:hypothetical protein